MNRIKYLNRESKEICFERVYGQKAIEWLYEGGVISTILGGLFLKGVIRYPWFSRLYGWLQKQRFSKNKTQRFIKEYGIDLSDFEVPKEGYPSFNDFFCRTLKENSREINENEKEVILPADGRYSCIQDLDHSSQFFIKGQVFDLESFLQDSSLSKEYHGGSGVFIRLCPVDYHRFHFPCDCVPGEFKLINGYLYSVNLIALMKLPTILCQNRRGITQLQTKQFGSILYCEIGATNVGSIQQTYQVNQFYKKGSEKGYFEFGGSAILILFQKNRIQIDSDLLESTRKGIEVLGKMGQSLGRSI